MSHPRRRHALTACLAVLALSCSFDEGALGPVDGLRLIVDSDPQGARILVDDRPTGNLTPDTVHGLRNRHAIQARLDTLGVTYQYQANVAISPADEIPVLLGPLVFRCGNANCYDAFHRYHTTSSLSFATNPVGAQFLRDGTSDGLIYPAGSGNSYASAGMPVFAGLLGGDTVALGVFDQPFLAGRPASVVSTGAGKVHVAQSTWVIPPARYLSLSRSPARGMEIRQEIVAEDATEGVVVLRITYTNITAVASYRRVDPFLPPEGVTLTEVFLGYVLDGDVGNADDDFVTYEPDLNAVVLYDSNFSESGYTAAWRNRPALQGLRILEWPAGARVMLNSYPRQLGDWGAARSNEAWGWNILSGLKPFQPDHPDLGIGLLQAVPLDMRLTVSAGPLTLRPGQSASITVAVAMAPPVDGTFESGGDIVPPGDPHDATRPIHAIAAHLLDRLAAAATVSLSPPPPPEPPGG